MGCTDRESNFQYTFYDPKDSKWWCTQGYYLVYAVPRGHEHILEEKLIQEPAVSGWKWHVRLNVPKQMWEAYTKEV